MKRRLLPLLTAAIAAAHPMGNFSVNHFTRLDVSPKGVDVTYVLDLAEIPTYQLFKEWKVDPKSPGLDERAGEQARGRRQRGARQGAAPQTDNRYTERPATVSSRIAAATRSVLGVAGHCLANGDGSCAHPLKS